METGGGKCRFQFTGPGNFIIVNVTVLLRDLAPLSECDEPFARATLVRKCGKTTEPEWRMETFR